MRSPTRVTEPIRRTRAPALSRELNEHVVPLERLTLGDRVYREFAEMLMRGQVKPGDKLPLRPLADRFGMSLMPVRDAVRLLANEGALQVLPNRAVVVPVLTLARLREVTLIRMSLEGAAAAAAALRIDGAGIERIGQRAREFTLAAAGPEAERVSRMLVANKALHFETYAAAGMPRLVGLIERQWLQVGPIMRIALELNRPKLKTLRAHGFHERMVDALRRRDAQAARSAVEDDIRANAEFIGAAGALEED